MYDFASEIEREYKTKFGDVYCIVIEQWVNENYDRIYLIEDDGKYVFIMNEFPLSWIPKEIILELCCNSRRLMKKDNVLA